MEAKMDEKRIFMEKVKSLRCLEEVEGFLTGRDCFPEELAWTVEERRMIMQRKYELMEKRK